jgi:hypothetical protein
VFWNKEDPVHFERFKEAAALFDHVFTTDANLIPAYEELRGGRTRSVQALQFAAQPRIHNPMAVVDPRSPEPVFAGTYYRNRHEDRRASLEMILDAARPVGLIIYDRTLGSESDEYGFPERFLPHVKGRLTYNQIVDVYKRHRVFLNANSVVDSPTMFSRRVFELLACGTAVLSTESIGMQELFGDLVPVATSLEDATAKLERLLHDDDHWTDITTRGRRAVLGAHTYRHRLHQIAKAAGFEFPLAAETPVAVLALADAPEDLAGVETALLAQTRRPDEILIGLRNGVAAERLDSLSEQLGAGRVRSVVQDAAEDRDQRWRELASLASAPWVAPFDSHASYRSEHLEQLAEYTSFADADVIAAAPDSEAHAHRFSDGAPAYAALARSALVAHRGWCEDPAVQRQWFEQGVRFYLGDPAPGDPEGDPIPQPSKVGQGEGKPRQRTRRR